MDVVERVARAAQAAIETLPYRWITYWDDDTGEETHPTLRTFYEGTWQGAHADEPFAEVGRIAARAAIAAVLDSMAEPSEAFISGGLAGIVNFDGSDFHVGPAKAVIAEMVWKAVHKAMRAEMLGATGETEV